MPVLSCSIWGEVLGVCFGLSWVILQGNTVLKSSRHVDICVPQEGSVCASLSRRSRLCHGFGRSDVAMATAFGPSPLPQHCGNNAGTGARGLCSLLASLERVIRLHRKASPWLEHATGQPHSPLSCKCSAKE